MEKKNGRKWTDEEVVSLKEHYNEISIEEISELLDRSVTSIKVKASKLGLKKDRGDTSDGCQLCNKCNRKLPWTYQYFPVIRGEKNPRRICRECNDKYGSFLSDDSECRMYWSKDDEELFVNRYPNYTNEELRDLFYPTLSDKQLSEKAYGLGVSFKTEGASRRARKQQSEKISVFMTGRVMPEETKIKLSEKRKQQYKDGTWIPSWTGRIPSKEERERLSKRVKGLWAGENNPRYINPLKGENNPNWNGGITFIYVALRENIREWKNKSIELCDYKCALTGTRFHDVHHVFPFNKIVDMSLSELNLEIKNNLGEYSDKERNDLIDIVKRNHEMCGLGLCLSYDIHKLFHNKYSYTDFTIGNFKEFIDKYFKGEYDNELEDNLKSINSKRNLEEVKKLASFYYAEN